MPSINFVLNQIQYNATTFQKRFLVCKLITKMYFFRLYANDNSPVSHPVTSTNSFHTNNTPFLRSNKRKKTKNEKGRIKISDKMTSKNQMRRGTDFWCPSLEFSLSRIGEKKAADRFQALNNKNSKIRKKGIKSEQQGVYFSGGSMSKVKRRSIESQSNSASEKTRFGPLKMQFFKRFCAKRGWFSGVRDTRAL
jgi:hypothetical protein